MVVFLTKVFAHYNVSFENEKVVQLTEVIDELVFVNSKLKFGADGILSWGIAEPIFDLTAPIESIPHSPISVPVPNPPVFQNSELHHLIGLHLKS